jgi:hypothetical protein
VHSQEPTPKTKAQHEELRWHRELESHTHDTRAAAYAEVMGVIESFDFVLYQSSRFREEGKALDEVLTAKVRKATREARRALGAVKPAHPRNCPGPAPENDGVPDTAQPCPTKHRRLRAIYLKTTTADI